VDRKLALFREVFDLDDVPVEAMCAAASLTRRLHAIDATPARWRGGATLSLLDLTSTTVRPAHWLIFTQVWCHGERGEQVARC